jgi:hypothetical protein
MALGIDVFSCIDHLKNRRQVGGNGKKRLGKTCWAVSASRGQRSACRSLHSFVDIQGVVTCARQCTPFKRQGVRNLIFSWLSLLVFFIQLRILFILTDLFLKWKGNAECLRCRVYWKHFDGKSDSKKGGE